MNKSFSRLEKKKIIIIKLGRDQNSLTVMRKGLHRGVKSRASKQGMKCHHQNEAPQSLDKSTAVKQP